MQNFILFTFLSLFLLNVTSFSQWVKTNGPIGAQITELISNEDEVYCFTYGDGGYRSDDNGANWQAINNGLTDLYVNDVAIQGDTLYALKSFYNYPHNGLFRSFNKGENWEYINTGLSFLNSIAVNGNYIFSIVNSGYGCAISSDAGITWNINTAAPSPLILFKNYENMMLAATDSVLCSTSDGGLTWDTLLNKCVTAIAVENNKIYVISNGLWMSDDDGNSWTLLNSYFNDQFFNLTVHNNYIYVIKNFEGCYRSTDSGQSWMIINSGFLSIMNNYITSIGNYVICGGYGTGIMRLQDQDTVWVESNNGIVSSNCYDITMKDNKIFAGTLGGSVHVTSDNGSSWNRLTTGLTNIKILSMGHADNYLYAGTWGGGLFRSSDDGETWEHTSYPKSDPYAIMYNNGKLFAGSSNGGYSSTDYGTSWSITGLGNFGILDFCKDSSGNIYAAGTEVYKSTNNGVDWTMISNEIPHQVNAIGSNGSYLFAGLLFGGMYRSSDKGESWQLINNGFGPDPQFQDIISYQGYVFAALKQGVFLSSDNGETWQNINDVQLHGGANSLLIKDGYLFVGTYASSVWKRHLSSVIPVELVLLTGSKINNSVHIEWKTATETNNRGFEIERKTGTDWITLAFINGKGTTTSSNSYSFIDNSGTEGYPEIFYRLKQIDFNGTYKYSKEISVINSVPFQFLLSQNYPNPFNPITSIRYSIAEKVHVTIKLFDLLGRELRTLVNEEKPAGAFEININSSGLASGVYIYRLTAGRFSESKRMIILK